MTLHKKIHISLDIFAERHGFTHPHVRRLLDISIQTSICLGLIAMTLLWWSPFMAWFWVGALISIGHILLLTKNIYALSSKKWATSLAFRSFLDFNVRFFATGLLTFGLIFFCNADIIALLCGLSTALWCLTVSILWST